MSSFATTKGGLNVGSIYADDETRMANTLPLADNVIGGGTALAGLILVYLGSAVTGYGGYDRTQQSAVRSSFQLRAWLACVGVLISIGAAGFGLVGKWTASPSLVAVGAAMFLLALLWGAGTAVAAATSVR